MGTSAAEGSAWSGSAPWETLRHAADALLSRRVAQRGRPTLGDEHDLALAAALASLVADPAALALARETGERVARGVYAKRFFEDTLGGAVVVLSTCLLESGLGTLRLADSFHRSARVEYAPSPALAACAPEVRDRFAEGVLAGFLSTAFNCDVSVHAEPGVASLRIELLDGRDVNRGGRSA